MLGIYRFSWDCGRAGTLDGVLIADSDDVRSIVGKYIHFGEVLGKHSDIQGTVEEGELKLVTNDPTEVAVVQKVFRVKTGTISGFSPFDYAVESEEE